MKTIVRRILVGLWHILRFVSFFASVAGIYLLITTYLGAIPQVQEQIIIPVLVMGLFLLAHAFFVATHYNWDKLRYLFTFLIGFAIIFFISIESLNNIHFIFYLTLVAYPDLFFCFVRCLDNRCWICGRHADSKQIGLYTRDIYFCNRHKPSK